MNPVVRLVKRAERDERGVFLVFWAMLLVAMLLMVAIVVDLGSYREERRDNRRASDAAAAAGALYLTADALGRIEACETAWKYAWSNLNITPPASPCGSLTVCTAATPGTPLSASAGGYTVTIMTPVPDNSDFMKANTAGPDLTQSVSTEDGDPCSRLAVGITETRATFFGGLIGQDEHTTNVHSVARRTSSIITIPASLVLLDPTGCNVLTATGSGSVQVGSFPSPDSDPVGGIVMISTGENSDSTCNTANKFVVDTGGGNQTGGVSVYKGDVYIGAYTDPVCSGHACSQPQIGAAGGLRILPPGSTTTAQPRTLDRDLVDRRFADYRYNCRANYNTTGPDRNYILAASPPRSNTPLAACTTAGGNDYLNDLYRSVVGRGSLEPQSPAVITDCNPGILPNQIPVGGVILGDAEIQCSLPNNFSLSVLGSAWFRQASLNPGSLTVGRNAVFDGSISIGQGNLLQVDGNVDFRGAGDIRINGGGTLQLGGTTGSTYPSTCYGDGFVSSNSATDACARQFGTDFHYTFLRDATIVQNGGNVILNRNFVYAGPTADLNMGGGGLLSWTQPTAGPFTSLALWSDKPDGEIKLTGGGALTMQGVFFAPAAQFTLAGSFPATPQEAQFFAYRLEQGGGGVFALRPSPNFIEIPVYGGIRLIR